jgi:hypothetical protein
MDLYSWNGHRCGRLLLGIDIDIWVDCASLDDDVIRTALTEFCASL